MCFSSVPKPPKALVPMRRDEAEDIADKGRKRKSVQDGYANWALNTGPNGVKDFGKAAQVPSLSNGSSPNLGGMAA